MRHRNAHVGRTSFVVRIIDILVAIKIIYYLTHSSGNGQYFVPMASPRIFFDNFVKDGPIVRNCICVAVMVVGL